MDKVIDIKFAVDRIEEDIVVLENIENNKIINVKKECLPKEIKELDVVIYDGKNYVLDDTERINRIKRIKEKMEKLRNGR